MRVGVTPSRETGLKAAFLPRACEEERHAEVGLLEVQCAVGLNVESIKEVMPEGPSVKPWYQGRRSYSGRGRVGEAYTEFVEEALKVPQRHATLCCSSVNGQISWQAQAPSDPPT